MVELYKTYVDGLQIPETFLAEHRSKIVTSLNNIYQLLSRTGLTKDDIVYCINSTIHLASSIVLSGSSHTAEVLKSIGQNPDLKGYDNTTLLTVAYMYHMLQNPEEIIGREAEQMQEQLEQIRQLVEKNWRSCLEAKKVLGLEKMIENPS